MAMSGHQVEQPACGDRRRQAAGSHVGGHLRQCLSHGRVSGETPFEVGLDALPHPGLVLRVAAGGELPGSRLQFAKARHRLPELREAAGAQRAELHHLRLPRLRAVVGVALLPEQAQRRRDLRPRARRLLDLMN